MQTKFAVVIKILKLHKGGSKQYINLLQAVADRTTSNNIVSVLTYVVLNFRCKSKLEVIHGIKFRSHEHCAIVSLLQL